MEDFFGFIALGVSIFTFLLFLNIANVENEENYKIYNECYQIEEKYYCK